MSIAVHPVARQIEETYRQRTPRSLELYHSAEGVLPGGDSRTITYFDPYPLYIESGQGPRLIDVDGNTYLDFSSGIYVTGLGHCHPRHR